MVCVGHILHPDPDHNVADVGWIGHWNFCSHLSHTLPLLPARPAEANRCVSPLYVSKAGVVGFVEPVL